MTTPVRVAGFVLGLLVVFLAARGVGAVAAPEPAPPAPMGHDGMPEPGHDGAETRGPAEHGDHEEPAESASEGPGASPSPTRATRCGSSPSRCPAATGRCGS